MGFLLLNPRFIYLIFFIGSWGPKRGPYIVLHNFSLLLQFEDPCSVSRRHILQTPRLVLGDVFSQHGFLSASAKMFGSSDIDDGMQFGHFFEVHLLPLGRPSPPVLGLQISIVIGIQCRICSPWCCEFH